MSRGIGAIAAILIFSFAATGCEKEQRVYPARQPTAGKAKLPSTPDLDPKPPRIKHEDGAWTVHGIVHADPKAREGELRVRGYVAALHTCADLAKGCKPAPYVQLTDGADRQGRRLLVGGAFEPARDGLKVGEVATVAGRYATASRDGLYFAPQGMLLFSPPLSTNEADADSVEAAKPAR